VRTVGKYLSRRGFTHECRSQTGYGKKVPVRTKAKLRDAANEHMVRLEQSPDRVRSFFQDLPVKYAA